MGIATVPDLIESPLATGGLLSTRPRFASHEERRVRPPAAVTQGNRRRLSVAIADSHLGPEPA